MNNSSDSDNEDHIKTKIDPQKKRGRPRKNLFLDKTIKSSEKKEITNDEKDIILHLPVFLPKEKNVKKDSEINTQKNETVLSISESESESDSESNSSISDSEDEESGNYKELYKIEKEENRKKDIIIKKLKEEKTRNTSSIYDSDIQKDLNKHVINMCLIDNNTNKVIENKKTDINCWWCTYNFDNYPCFIPEKYYNDKYYVFGCFCSFNCASSYNLNMGDYKVMERYALLKKIYDNNTDKNKLAPPKEVLKKYGGIVDIEDYRKNFITCDTEYRLNLPPLVGLYHVITEIVTEKVDKDSFKNNMNNLKKKLPVVKNNLFNTMGIKNK